MRRIFPFAFLLIVFTFLLNSDSYSQTPGCRLDNGTVDSYIVPNGTVLYNGVTLKNFTGDPIPWDQRVSTGCRAQFVEGTDPNGQATCLVNGTQLGHYLTSVTLIGCPLDNNLNYLILFLVVIGTLMIRNKYKNLLSDELLS